MPRVFPFILVPSSLNIFKTQKTVSESHFDPMSNLSKTLYSRLIYNMQDCSPFHMWECIGTTGTLSYRIHLPSRIALSILCLHREVYKLLVLSVSINSKMLPWQHQAMFAMQQALQVEAKTAFHLNAQE